MIAISAVPIAIDILAKRSSYAFGPAVFWTYLDLMQPLLTAMLAAAIAVDGVTRERDEGSLLVVSLAPLSAAGYALRRWLSIVFVLIPVTFVPRVVAYFAAADHAHQLIDPASFVLGWVIRVPVVVVVVSALSFAMGTITSRTVLALIFGFLTFTMVLGFANDLAARTHRTFEGVAAIFGFDPYALSQLIWTLRGWRAPSLPTDAGYPFRDVLDRVVSESMLPVAIAIFFIGVSTLYLRRTRPDMRPFRIRADHPTRNLLASLIRVRDEYMPDGGLERTEWLALALATLLSAATIALLVRRYDYFASLAAERYASEQGGPRAMSTDVDVETLTIRGRIDGTGFATTSADLTLTNRAAAPITQLGFALNPGMRIDDVAIEGGAARVQRIWERVGVTIDPPLAPGVTRHLRFAVSGTPGTYEFALQGGRGFTQRYRRYLRAKDANELSDLSRSHLVHAASNVLVNLAASDLAPIPRHSPWTIGEDSVAGAAFTPDAMASSPRIDVQLALPRGLVAADSCSAIGSGSIRSACVMPVNDYRIAAAPWAVTDIGSGISFALLPAHAGIARAHSQTIAGAVRLAREAWPGVRLPDRITFVEKPTANDEEESYYYRPADIRTAGAMNLMPEIMIMRKQLLDTRSIAATLITNSLMARRRVNVDQRGFFRLFLHRVALGRLGKQLRSAVVPPVPGTPVIVAILRGNDWNNRLEYVLPDLENRVGSDRLMQGIGDFLSSRNGSGNAKELLQAIARRSGVNLDRMYDDYFTGEALPRLSLETVTFTRNGGAWSVRGAIHNGGTGEAFCPVVLRTSAGALRETVRVDSGQTIPFVFATEYEPRAVQLDPDRVCYRFGYIGSVDSVDYRGSS